MLYWFLLQYDSTNKIVMMSVFGLIIGMIFVLHKYSACFIFAGSLLSVHKYFLTELVGWLVVYSHKVAQVVPADCVAFELINLFIAMGTSHRRFVELKLQSEMILESGWWHAYIAFLFFSGVSKRSSDTAQLVIMTIMGMVLGYFMGVSYPSVSLSKVLNNSS